MIIYDSLFNLLESYIFGTVTSGTYEELVCIIGATIGSLFLVSLPFIVVWRMLSIGIGGWR